MVIFAYRHRPQSKYVILSYLSPERKTMNLDILKRRTVVVRLNVHQWSGMLTDKNVVRDVRVRANASGDVGIFRKRLLAKESMETMKKITSNAKNVFDKKTLPWNSPDRLCQVKNYYSLRDEIDNFSFELEKSRDEFLAEYEKHVEEARIALGDLFRLTDYPTVEELKGKIRLKMSMMPFPEQENFFLVEDMDQEEIATLKNALETDMTDKLKCLSNNLLTESVNLISNFKECLENGGIFRDAMANNIISLTNSLQGLDMIEDDKINKSLSELKDYLQSVNLDELRRRNKNYIQEEKDNAQNTLTKAMSMMQGYMA